MRRLLLLIGLCLFIVDAFSQGNLILRYRGLQDEVLVTAYVMACTANDNSDENIGRAYDFYYAHEDEIIDQYDAACFIIYLNRLEDVRAVNREATNQAIAQIAAGFAQIAADYRQKREMEEQQEQQIKMQKRAEMEARMANSPDRRPQAISNYRTQSSGYKNSTYRTQGSYNDLLTSDPNWNQQVQMMVQQYGVEKTREMVKNKRSNDYSQQQQVQRSQPQIQSERIISAVTSNRQQINIKVNSLSVVAFSNGIDQFGNQNWQTVFNAHISRCGVGTPYDGPLAREFSYTAQINGTSIYFNM